MKNVEDLAAWLNALLVCAVPFGLMAAESVFAPSTAVHPPRSLWATAIRETAEAATIVIPFIPLAVLAGWRTWVHVKRRRERQATGFQGIAEAGVTGFVIAFAVLLPGIVAHPTAAPPYIVAYGGMGFVIGLAFGFVLAMAALLVLALRRPA